MAQDGRAGRRDPLAGRAVVDEGEALQQARCRRSRHGHQPVRGTDPSRPQRQGRGAPAPRAHGRDQVACAHDVGDRVPRPHLVEAHLVRRHAMHPSLGLGQQGEDGQGVDLGPRVDRRRLQVRPDGAPALVIVNPRVGGMVVVVRMGWMAAGVMDMGVGMLMRAPGRLSAPIRRADLEPATAEHPIAVGDKRAGCSRRRHGADAGEHAGLVLGEGVQQGGDEHVSGDSAQHIEMDPHDPRIDLMAGSNPAHEREPKREVPPNRANNANVQVIFSAGSRVTDGPAYPATRKARHGPSKLRTSRRPRRRGGRRKPWRRRRDPAQPVRPAQHPGRRSRRPAPHRRSWRAAGRDALPPLRPP